MPTCSSAPVQTMQFCRWQPSCTITLSMSTLLMIFTLLPSLHMAPNTLRLMLHLSLHASSTPSSPMPAHQGQLKASYNRAIHPLKHHGSMQLCKVRAHRSYTSAHA